MKVLRFLLIGAGIFALLLVILLGLALSSPIQTWAAKKIVAGDPSLGVVQLGKVSAGFRRIEITDVKLVRPGVSLTLPSATIELPLMGAIENKIEIRRLEARGWTLDLTGEVPKASRPAANQPETTSKSTDVPSAFEGIFKTLELPVDLSVESADVAGVIIFPIQPGQAPGRAEVTISGGQLASGREGRFTLKANATLPDGVTPVSQLSSVSTLILKMDTPRTFTRVSVANETNASGPGVPNGARLFTESSAARETDRETYDLLVKSQVGGSEKKLVALNASSRSANTPITGTWTFDINDVDIAPFTLGRTLPRFTFAAGGTFQTDPLFKEVQLSGKTDLSAENLDSVYAGLSALGRVQLLSDFDVVQRSTSVRVNRLSVDVVGKTPVLSLQSLQALEIVPATGEIKVAAPDTDLVKISLKALPLAWTRPFAPADLSVTGEDVRGEFLARAHNGGFAVRSLAPLTMANLAVVQAGKALIQGVDLSVAASGDYTAAGWQADVSDLSARSRGVTLFTLAVRAGQSSGAAQPIKATGRLRADLPALMAQPVASEFSVFGQGAADMEFTASVSETVQQISSKLSLAGLRTRDGQNLPSISSDLRADRHPAGHVEANVPLVFDLAGRKSDIELTASIKPAGEGMTLDAQIFSRELYVEDLTLFTALQPAKPASAPTPKTTPTSESPGPAPAPAPDSEPVWAGITGQLRLALKKVVYAAAQPPVEISTSVKITPEVLTLESLNAVFPDGAAAKVDAAITFQAGKAEPYDIATHVSATNLDPQPFLEAANPGKPPTVQGKFDFTGKIAGRAPSLDRFADKANVDAQLVSRGGRFNGFATSALAANVGKLPEAASKVGGLLSIAGSVLGKSELARAGEKARASSDTIKRLVNFNFDQLNIDITHRAGESATEIKNFSILSPDMRLLGGGSIDSKSGLRSILQSAMNLDLQMAVRGAQADDLRILDLLKRQPDELGYTALAENFSVKGTPSQMDVSSLIQLIVSKLR
jgi:hypothetical protein